MINSVLAVGAPAESSQQTKKAPVSGSQEEIKKNPNKTTYTAPRIRTKCLLLLKSQKTLFILSLYTENSLRTALCNS